MDIKLWYSKHMKQWRWSLIDPTTGNQESGQQFDLRQAMTDVAVKVENMVDNHEYEGQENGWKN
tara:strand:- start:7129 stop:7320 length:192 start_codon:yes stop_codon:yes gene_type:complete